MKAIDNPEIKQWVMDCGIMASRIGRERLLDLIDAHTAAAVAELSAVLQLSEHELHPADEDGECLCSQCVFVRARNKIIAR